LTLVGPLADADCGYEEAGALLTRHEAKAELRREQCGWAVEIVVREMIAFEPDARV
jgi:hypothetical protein